MDESDLFAGIDAHPASSQEGTSHRAPRAPEDSVPPVPAKPVAMLSHEHLAANALCHLRECPTLAGTAGAVAEECLAAGARFPHTLLVGPADSSKRTIARAIAADMAAPFHHVEMLEVTGPDLMHAAFTGIPDGAVVLVSGIDTVSSGALSGLARVASARRSVRQPDLGDMLRRMEREPWRRGSRTKDRPRRAYGDFTMVLTARRHVPSDSPLHRWLQLQFFTRRCAETEAVRLGRLFRRAGWDPEPEAIGILADFAVRYGVRTLQFANGLTLALRALGGGSQDDGADAGPLTLEPGSARRMLRYLFAESMDPTRVAEADREDRRRDRRKRAAAKRAAAERAGSTTSTTEETAPAKPEPG
jgi:hypothetical protein